MDKTNDKTKWKRHDISLLVSVLVFCLAVQVYLFCLESQGSWVFFIFSFCVMLFLCLLSVWAIRRQRGLTNRVREGKIAILAAIENSRMQFWQYFPLTHQANVMAGIKLDIPISGRMDNFPESFLTLELLHPEDQAAFMDMHHRIDEGAEEASADVRIKYGEVYHWKRLHYVLANDDTEVKAIGISIDLEPYKDMEKQFSIAVAQAGIYCSVYNLRNHSMRLEYKGCRRYYENVPDSIMLSGRIHPEDSEKYYKMYQHMEHGDQSVSDIIRYCFNKKESYVWLRLSYTVIMGNDGKPEYAFGSGVDITEQKLAEERCLAESMRRQALEKGIVTMTGFNVTQDILLGSDLRPLSEGSDGQAKKMVDVVAERMLVLPRAADRQYLQTVMTTAHLKKMYREGHRSFAFDYVRKIGVKGMHWYRDKVDLIEQPETRDVLALICVQDIDKERRRNMVLESIIDEEIDFAAYVDTASGQASFVKTDAAIDKLGLPEEFSYADAYESVLRTYLTEEDMERVLLGYRLDNLMDSLEETGTKSYTFRAVVNGQEYHKKSRCFYLDDIHTTLVFLQWDVTDLYLEEERQSTRLQVALSEAEQASREKSDFLSRVSHEIRTPMNAIIGLTALSEKRLHDEKYLARNLDKIDSAAHFLLELINDILDLSRIERGKMEINKQPMSFVVFLDDVNTIIQSRADEKQVHYEVHKEGTIHDYYVFDSVKLKQVLINILSNAVKFTPAGGTVSFTAVQVDKSEEMARLRFEMKDNGIGIEQKFLPKVFNAFEQEYATNTTLYGGTGLGLAISKRIIDLMGGRIDVSSEKGIGTTFVVTVELDLYKGLLHDKEELGSPGSGLKFDFVGKRVLLAEDNEINSEIACSLLEMRGFEIVTAVDGREAVAQYKEKPAGYFDIILMDVRMPYMDGLTAAGQIRGMGREDSRTVPILAMTANAFEDDIKKSLEAGMDGHLTKPIEPQILYNTIRGCLLQRERQKETDI